MIEKQKTIEQEYTERDIAALQYVITDDRGRWFLKRLFERCRIEQAFTSADPHILQQIEAERNVALEIKSNILELGQIGFHALQEMEEEYWAFLQYCKALTEGDRNYG